MKHEVSKRRQPIVRTVVYSFMTLTVIVIVSLLMLVVLGYSFDEKAGRLEQGGLLQFASVPQGATVTLDETRLGPRTNSKATVSAGNHSVSFDRDGYRSWKKSIVIKPAQIGWLNYARLIPQNITTESVREFPSLSGALASPQYNFMILHEFPDRPQFLIANIQGDTVRYDDIAVPSSVYTAPEPSKMHTFTIDSWSYDEQLIILRHNFDDNKEEWILLNRSAPARSLNINRLFAIEPSKVQFAGKGSQLLFAQVADTVRRLNIDNPSAQRTLATRVESFSSYDDKTVVFSALPDENNQRIVGYATPDSDNPQTIATYPNDGQLLQAAVERYFNRYYVSILHGQQLSISTGSSLPISNSTTSPLKLFAKLTTPVGALRLTMTDNGRFVMVQLPDGYSTYDIELQKYDKITWAIQSTAPRAISWLDRYIIWSDNGGKLRFYEFDGANQQNIMDVAEGYSVSLSPNEKYVYAIGKTADDKRELRRALLQLP
jgi:hypothetical protein